MKRILITGAGSFIGNRVKAYLEQWPETYQADTVSLRSDSWRKQSFQGYDTILTDDAANISKGQKQLLTIARAMLQQCHLLILDEATSNVDIRTEMRIQSAMRALMRDKTCFVIAHRLSTIRNADLILVVQDGEIVEQGRHEALLARNGVYAALYRAQFE